MNKQRKFSMETGLMLTGAVFLTVILACTQKSDARPNFVFKDPPREGVVAKVAGTEILADELKKGSSEAAIQLVELEQKIYDLSMERIKEIMEDKLIGVEAEKAKLPLEQYINDKIVKNAAKPSQKEFDQFIKERNVPQDKISPELKDRIMGFLTDQKKSELVQAKVASLTKNNPVEVYIKKPKGIEVALGEAPVWGDESAPVTIVEFSDFQCPFCSRGAETVDEIKKKYKKSQVRIAFKHFPLPSHPEAKPASEASMCVAEQKKDKFWAMHDIIFKNQKDLKPENLEKWAKEVGGADIAKYKECLTSGKYKAFVEADLSQGEKLGVRATPTFFINGRLLSGAQPFERFKELIDEELAAKK